MRRWLVGAVVALLALAVSVAIVAGNSASFKGSSESNETASERAVSQSESRPFIGVVVSTLSPAKAEEVGVPGGAVVRRVLEDGPSGGVLEVGDVILSINGQQVDGARTVLEAVHSSQVGDVLSIDILRGDLNITVQVTVGERELPDRPQRPDIRRNLPNGNSLLGILTSPFLNKAWSAEIVIGTDEGSKTISLLSGTVSAVSQDANSITVSPADGTDDVTFQLTDDSQVVVNGRKAELSDIELDQQVRVVSVDGEVEMVAVGGLKTGHGIGPRPDPQKKPFHGIGPRQKPHKGPRFFIGRGFEINPEIMEKVCDRLPEEKAPPFCQHDDDDGGEAAPSSLNIPAIPDGGGDSGLQTL